MIFIISGTNRPGSNTRKVAAHVEAIYKSLSVKTQLLDLAEMPPDIFSPASYATKPAGFSKFTDAILAADGLVIVTPEYNGGIPGVLKYFIDMLPFPESFEHRPVCFVGLAAGIWGALRPVEQLQAIFGYRNAYICDRNAFHTLQSVEGRHGGGVVGTSCTLSGGLSAKGNVTAGDSSIITPGGASYTGNGGQQPDHERQQHPELCHHEHEHDSHGFGQRDSGGQATRRFRFRQSDNGEPCFRRRRVLT